MRKSAVRCFAILFIIGASAHAIGSDESEPGVAKPKGEPSSKVIPLRVALAGLSAPPEHLPLASAKIGRPADVIARVVQAEKNWFRWAGDQESHDVLIGFEHAADSMQKKEHWRVRIRSPIAEEKVMAFPTLAAVETFLLLDLQRLYIVKNISAIQSDEIPVKLSINGSMKKIYLEGESLAFQFRSDVAGYLNLVSVDCQANIVLLFPYGDESNAIEASDVFQVPHDPALAYEVRPPFGSEYVKAIFTTVPLDLSFLSEAEEEDVQILLESLRTEVRSAGVRGAASASRGGRLGTAEIHFETKEKSTRAALPVVSGTERRLPR